MARGNPGIAEVLSGADVNTTAMVADEFVGAACRADPQLFDLDALDRNSGDIVRAIVTCYSCPVLDRCARYLASVEPAPFGMVWAGMVLDHAPNRTPRWHRAFQRTIARFAPTAAKIGGTR